MSRDEPLLMTSAAARLARASEAAVRAAERSGKLPAVKTESGVRLFSRQDVERWAQERRGQ